MRHAGRRARRRPRRRRAGGPRGDVPADPPRGRRPRLPAGPDRAARRRRPGGLPLVEHRAGRLYRRQERIPEDLGTAVNVQAMVFGNRGADSGSGVCFTRDPATGHRGVYGDYLVRAQGEDVVAGIRNTVPLVRPRRDRQARPRRAARGDAASSRATTATCATSSSRSRTAGCGSCRPGSASAPRRRRSGSRGPWSTKGVIDADEAVRRVTGAQLALLMFPRFDPERRADPADHAASAPRRARPSGRIALDSATAVRLAAAGDQVVLVRSETNPDDLPGMVAAVGVLTSRGGKTSHAAVVARGMGRTCVCGADELEVDVEQRVVRVARGRPSPRATRCPSTAPPARCSPARSRSPSRWSSGTSTGRTRARRAERPRRRGRLRARPRRRRTPPRGAGQRRHPRRRRPGPPVRRPAASGCAAPSTCSSARAASWSSG